MLQTENRPFHTEYITVVSVKCDHCGFEVKADYEFIISCKRELHDAFPGMLSVTLHASFNGFNKHLPVLMYLCTPCAEKLMELFPSFKAAINKPDPRSLSNRLRNMLSDDLFEPVTPPICTLVNLHVPGQKYDVYIGRGRNSIWANPYSHLSNSLAEIQVKTRDEAIACYREYILTRKDLLGQLPTLYGKVLGCWCVPERCHGEVLIELAYLMRSGKEL